MKTRFLLSFLLLAGCREKAPPVAQETSKEATVDYEAIKAARAERRKREAEEVLAMEAKHREEAKLDREKAAAEYASRQAESKEAVAVDKEIVDDWKRNLRRMKLKVVLNRTDGLVVRELPGGEMLYFIPHTKSTKGMGGGEEFDTRGEVRDFSYRVNENQMLKVISLENP